MTGGRAGPGSRTPLGSHPLDPQQRDIVQGGPTGGEGEFLGRQGILELKKLACDYRGGVFFFKGRSQIILSHFHLTIRAGHWVKEISNEMQSLSTGTEKQVGEPGSRPEPGDISAEGAIACFA